MTHGRSTATVLFPSIIIYKTSVYCEYKNYKMKQVTLLTILALSGCVAAQSQTKPQKGNFDLGRLIGGEPLWQKIDQNLPQVQQLVDKTKQRCMAKLGMPAPQRSLIREPFPTPKEKCLIECVLTGINLVSRWRRRRRAIS